MAKRVRALHPGAPRARERRAASHRAGKRWHRANLIALTGLRLADDPLQVCPIRLFSTAR